VRRVAIPLRVLGFACEHDRSARAERRRVLRRMALATGVIDKAGGAAYERLIRPAAYRLPDWIERYLTQAAALRHWRLNNGRSRRGPIRGK
jgi:hypothetical protein